MARFNAANAREMAVRSHEARRQRKESRAQTSPAPLTTAHLSTPDARLSLVLEQIDCTRDVLNDDKFNWCPECKRGGIEPHHRAQLLKSLDTLLDRQRELLGIPRTGSRRPGREREQRRPDWWGFVPRVAALAAQVPPSTQAPATVPGEPLRG
jgi:hypothetical protein